MFTHLHGHSTFSFLEALGKPIDIVKKAKSLGMKGIAITDLGGMYSAIRFYQAAKKQEITPILGVELNLSFDINDTNNLEKIGTLCLLASSSEGYLNLIKIVSVANTRGIKNGSKIDFSTLEKYSTGIKVFFGGESSWIGKKILNNDDPKKITEILQKFINIFGQDSVFLEIIAQDYSDIPLLKKINTEILNHAEILNLGVIVDNQYKYINQSDKESWEIALAIKDGKKIYEQDRRKPKGDFSLQTEDQIIETCLKNGYTQKQVEQWIATNNKIMKDSNVEIDMYQSLFPVHQTPENIQEKYEKIKGDLIEKM